MVAFRNAWLSLKMAFLVTFLGLIASGAHGASFVDVYTIGYYDAIPQSTSVTVLLSEGVSIPSTTATGYSLSATWFAKGLFSSPNNADASLENVTLTETRAATVTSTYNGAPVTYLVMTMAVRSNPKIHNPKGTTPTRYNALRVSLPQLTSTATRTHTPVPATATATNTPTNTHTWTPTTAFTATNTFAANTNTPTPTATEGPGGRSVEVFYEDFGSYPAVSVGGTAYNNNSKFIFGFDPATSYVDIYGPTVLGHSGLLLMTAQLATTANVWATTAIDTWVIGDGRTHWETNMSLVQLSSADNGATVRMGFMDSSGIGDAADGLFWRYTHAVNSGKWQLCASQGTTLTATDSGIAGNLGFHRFEIDANSAGTTVLWRYDGSVIATTTSNIPTGITQSTGISMGTQKSLGVGRFDVFYDYVRAWREITR